LRREARRRRTAIAFRNAQRQPSGDPIPVEAAMAGKPDPKALPKGKDRDGREKQPGDERVGVTSQGAIDAQGRNLRTA
jgi:hypothetical protein